MNELEKVKIYSKTVYYICELILKKGNMFEQQYALKICNQAIQLLRDTEKLYYFVELLEQKIELIKNFKKELRKRGELTVDNKLENFIKV